MDVLFILLLKNTSEGLQLHEFERTQLIHDHPTFLRHRLVRVVGQRVNLVRNDNAAEKVLMFAWYELCEDRREILIVRSRRRLRFLERERDRGSMSI